MTIEEVKFFLSAYENIAAKSLVKKMMIGNYSEAVLTYHPDLSSQDREQIEEKCTILCDDIFSRIDAIQRKPEDLFSLVKELSRSHVPKSSIWFDEFDIAYRKYKHLGKLKMRLAQLSPFFHGNSFCDIGCGGGDLVAYVQKEYTNFTECAGIDVLDWRTESVKEKINFQKLDFSKPNTRSKQKYDTLTCLAVLHHVGNTDKSRETFLLNLHSAFKTNGRLIVEEDVIIPREEWELNKDYKEQIEINISQSSNFEDFINLNKKDQKDAIIIIDLLANSLSVGVPDMPFPFGFKTIIEWKELFNQSGYTVEKVLINGFTQVTFNRSSHVFFILKSKQI